MLRVAVAPGAHQRAGLARRQEPVLEGLEGPDHPVREHLDAPLDRLRRAVDVLVELLELGCWRAVQLIAPKVHRSLLSSRKVASRIGDVRRPMLAAGHDRRVSPFRCWHDMHRKVGVEGDRGTVRKRDRIRVKVHTGASLKQLLYREQVDAEAGDIRAFVESDR